MLSIRRVLSRPPAVYPGEMGIYQDRMPLYINCTEVTHIYTNGSYQLVYQNCTPLFVRAKQVRYMAYLTLQLTEERGHIENMIIVLP